MTNEETQQMPVQEKKEECPHCQMMKMSIAASFAHGSCSTIESEEGRDRCMEWAAGLQPEELKEAEKVMEAAYEQVGAEGLDKYAEMYNLLARQTIITKVGDKLARQRKGEQVEITPIEKALYRKFTSENMRI
jgi:hypothetical protein